MRSVLSQVLGADKLLPIWGAKTDIGQKRKKTMDIDFANVLYFLSIPVMIAVAIVLLIGLFMMMRGGDPKKQNKMMFARIYLQAIAIALMVGAVYLVGSR